MGVDYHVKHPTAKKSVLFYVISNFGSDLTIFIVSKETVITRWNSSGVCRVVHCLVCIVICVINNAACFISFYTLSFHDPPEQVYHSTYSNASNGMFSIVMFLL